MWNMIRYQNMMSTIANIDTNLAKDGFKYGVACIAFQIITTNVSQEMMQLRTWLR